MAKTKLTTKPQINANGKRKPTAKDWDLVKNMYLRGEDVDSIIKALPDIDLKKGTVLNKMSSSGATALLRAINQEVDEGLKRTIVIEKEKTNEACVKLFTTGAKVIEELLDQYQAEAKEGGLPKNQAKATAYNIDLLMSGVTKIQKGLRVAYGMDKDGKLIEEEPEITIIDGLNVNNI